jgi:hypothetical protein
MFGMMMLFLVGFTLFCFYILILGFWDVYGRRKEENVSSRQVND